jgi:cell division ATPase FtsA
MIHVLPLGIDIGATRIRIAVAERRRDGAIRILGIASRERVNCTEAERDAAAVAVLEDLSRELGLRRQRECVSALGSPQATLRNVRFPKMSWFERRNAARFEALGEYGAARKPVRVRLHSVDRTSGVFAVGTVDEMLLRHHVSILQRARLRVAGVDHDACALQRVLSDVDAVVDIGYETLRLHVFLEGAPLSWTAGMGGADVTRCIARDLLIDAASAERRKRILGVAGAGESARESCVEAICALIEEARAGGVRVSEIGFIGNGARLPGVAESVAERTDARVRTPVSLLMRTARLSDEAVESGSPDWTLAAALTTWRAA